MGLPTEREVIEKYPEAYRSLRHGFECGRGWFPILDEAGERLEKIGRKDSRADEPIVVKQKFCSLEIQGVGVFKNQDRAFDVASWATGESLNHCEWCYKFCPEQRSTGFGLGLCNRCQTASDILQGDIEKKFDFNVRARSRRTRLIIR